MKIYRVTLTLSIDAHVIAQTDDEARELAESDADEWFRDVSATAIACARPVAKGWDEGELPYLTDAAEVHARDAEMSVDSTVEQWAAALKE